MMAVLGGSFGRTLWLGSSAQASGLQSAPVACWNGALLSSNRSGAKARMAEQGSSLPAAQHAASPLATGTHCSKEVQWEVLLNGSAVGIATVAAAMILPEMASAVEASAGSVVTQFTELLAREPANALSLPTWTIHVASVAEWITAMSLVWQYGDTPGKAAWKGLAWGMVPLLGGAMCACTWHFFYNTDSLAELVVLQGALTLIGNFTMWIAAFRIYLAARENQTAP